MLNDLETFTSLFNKLKTMVNDSPATLSWLSEQKSEVRRLAYLVGDVAGKIRKSKAKNAEHHTIVPTGFSTAWKRFESQFDVPIRAIVDQENQSTVKGFLIDIERLAEQKGVSKDQLLDEICQDISASREPGDSFDPVVDDPVRLIDGVFNTYEQMASYEREDGAGEVFYDKGVGAWLFFERTIGLNHQAIYDRWKRIPELLIPSHALQINSARPVIELYNEAVRCYVFGNMVASIAMCRALLEHVLKKHHKLDAGDLEKTVSMAEARYSHLGKMKLHEKRKLANEIMHKYEKHQNVEDKVVIEFLKTLQAIVLQIPRNT